VYYYSRAARRRWWELVGVMNLYCYLYYRDRQLRKAERASRI
jgi:hypothetical protein